ncbi:hypothetical protein HID58_005198 [Brassica napus]|uniref:Uncharacterized protein n=1 Tax=Brassica napus TaxID=3708 RepID=A0ABQ8E7Y1_BRANA|nr:hypothetical protein HID58_005198 [Brassica napus]
MYSASIIISLRASPPNLLINLRIDSLIRSPMRNPRGDDHSSLHQPPFPPLNSGIDSMRPNFPLDSVARSMGLAPKVTSMIRMNVSANLGGDKLKTIDKLKAGVLVGLMIVFSADCKF